MKNLLLLFSLLSICSVECISKNNTNDVILVEKNGVNKEFNNMKQLFPEMNVPHNFKSESTIPSTKINKISKSLSQKYFFFKDSDLLLNDYDVNFDENIVYDNWVENLPGAIYKISEDECIALIYGLVKNGTYKSTYESKMFTFSYDGKFIDSMTIRSQYTPESDCKECVFLSRKQFLIFKYIDNFENVDGKTGRYIDFKKPLTIVEISEYIINDRGKIHFVKKLPPQYLKESVVYYREYHSNSDDPMNKY